MNTLMKIGYGAYGQTVIYFLIIFLPLVPATLAYRFVDVLTAIIILLATTALSAIAIPAIAGAMHLRWVRKHCGFAAAEDLKGRFKRTPWGRGPNNTRTHVGAVIRGD